MSRLDDLLQLRKEIDAEIDRERATQVRTRRLAVQAAATMTRGNWTTRVFYAACEHFGVTPDRVLDGNRSQASVNARHVAMWLMRDAGRSYPEIGAQLDMDHTTAINGVRRVDRDQQLLATAHLIRTALTGEDAA